MGSPPHLRFNSFDICIHAEQEVREPHGRKRRALLAIRLRSGGTNLAFLENAQKAAHDHFLLVPRFKHAGHRRVNNLIWSQGPRTDKLCPHLCQPVYECSLTSIAEYRNYTPRSDKSVPYQFLHHPATLQRIKCRRNYAGR